MKFHHQGSVYPEGNMTVYGHIKSGELRCHCHLVIPTFAKKGFVLKIAHA